MVSHVSFWQIKMESGNADTYIPWSWVSWEKSIYFLISWILIISQKRQVIMFICLYGCSSDITNF